MVFGTIWMGQSAKKGTETAVHSVSLLYLDELAGRREQVVENSLQNKIEVIRVAVSLMTEDDLSSAERLQAYQARMKQLFRLEKYAFVDRNGLIYTSLGPQTNIDDYDFDYRTLSEPEISVLNPESADKKAVIAVPIDPLAFSGEELVVCFMEIDMEEMLAGVSVDAQNTEMTFCNIYTADGFALSNKVLGGQTVGNNLLEALKNAVFDVGYSYDQVVSDFAEGNDRDVSFTYNGIRETMSYVPVTGTSWMLTYLVRESVISDRISSISDDIVRKSITQSVLTIAVMLILFSFIFYQIRKNARLILETETAHRAAMKRKGVQARKEKEKADLAGRRILLAEDMHVNAEIMMMVLQMRQMEADHAENGRIAVEKFVEHESGYYDAILMDMRMPEMDGLEATRAIRAMDRPDAKSIPIIALTANAFDEDVQRSMQAGLNAHLSKPVQPETLFETLENLI